MIGVLPPITECITVFPKKMFWFNQCHYSIFFLMDPKTTVHGNMHPTSRILQILGMFRNCITFRRHSIYFTERCSRRNSQFIHVDFRHISMLACLSRMKINLGKYQSRIPLLCRHPIYFHHQIGTTQYFLHQDRSRIGRNRERRGIITLFRRFVFRSASYKTEYQTYQ